MFNIFKLMISWALQSQCSFVLNRRNTWMHFKLNKNPIIQFYPLFYLILIFY